MDYWISWSLITKSTFPFSYILKLFFLNVAEIEVVIYCALNLIYFTNKYTHVDYIDSSNIMVGLFIKSLSQRVRVAVQNRSAVVAMWVSVCFVVTMYQSEDAITSASGGRKKDRPQHGTFSSTLCVQLQTGFAGRR